MKNVRRVKWVFQTLSCAIGIGDPGSPTQRAEQSNSFQTWTVPVDTFRFFVRILKNDHVDQIKGTHVLTIIIVNFIIYRPLGHGHLSLFTCLCYYLSLTPQDRRRFISSVHVEIDNMTSHGLT